MSKASVAQVAAELLAHKEGCVERHRDIVRRQEESARQRTELQAQQAAGFERIHERISAVDQRNIDRFDKLEQEVGQKHAANVSKIEAVDRRLTRTVFGIGASIILGLLQLVGVAAVLLLKLPH